MTCIDAYQPQYESIALILHQSLHLRQWSDLVHPKRSIISRIEMKHRLSASDTDTRRTSRVWVACFLPGSIGCTQTQPVCIAQCEPPTSNIHQIMKSMGRSPHAEIDAPQAACSAVGSQMHPARNHPCSHHCKGIDPRWCSQAAPRVTRPLVRHCIWSPRLIQSRRLQHWERERVHRPALFRGVYDTHNAQKSSSSQYAWTLPWQVAPWIKSMNQLRSLFTHKSTYLTQVLWPCIEKALRIVMIDHNMHRGKHNETNA